MAPPTLIQQRALISQFVNLTGATDRVAARFLKSAGFKMNEAVDAFFNAAIDGKPSPLDTKLDALFNSLRDDKNDPKDKLELDSTMKYFGEKLGASLENAELFVIMELLQAPAVGEITRKGYLEAWKKIATPEPSHQLHAAHIRMLVSSLSKDAVYFRRVYKYVFVAGKENDQRALSLDTALVYWSMLFSAPGIAWKTDKRDWLELWKSFLQEKWTRSVNRDMWNMTLEFALKSIDDENLSFWSEDGAWPSVIDDFVEWCQGKGIVKIEPRAETMDVDQ